MRKILLTMFIWIAVISAVATTVTDAQATCGSANCFLVTGTQEGITTPGQIIMDLSYRFIPMDQAYKGDQKASEAVVPGIDFANGVIEPGGHTEKRTNNEMGQIDASYGVNSKFALTLTVPFLNNRRHEHIDAGEFRNTDGTTGFGDIRLTGKYALWVSTKHLLVGGLGIKAPTGEYKLLNSEGEINEPTLMPGTGSWDGIISAHYAYQIRPHALDAFLSGSYQVATRNSLEYSFGNTLLLNGGMRYLIDGPKPTTLSLQVNMRQAPHDAFKGEVVPSTGGRWVYLTPGVTLQASPNTAFYTHVQLPVYQYVNEENLAPRYGLIFGVSHAF